MFKFDFVGVAYVPAKSGKKWINENRPGWVLFESFLAVALQLNPKILNALCDIFHFDLHFFLSGERQG
jgi:hypothetical protein